MKVVPDYAQMAALHDKGWSAQRIADAVNCTERTVTRWRERTGRTQPLPPNAGLKLSPERRTLIEEMLEDGASFNEIIATVHVSRRTMQRHFPGRGWSPQLSGQISALTRKFNQLPDHAQ